MRMYDIIAKKRDGGVLTDAEIAFFIDGCVSGEVPDYQLSALLMAIYFRGLTPHETAVLTDCMARSGACIDLSAIEGCKVDKHSTGGVGDKTTMVIAPIVAACGVPVAKMSGRGLGHTGGTVDKLEAIPGFRTEMPPEEFIRTVQEHGVCVIGQSGNLAPADKKLYALRDVTATVNSIPLIAASIMSKKIAAGSDCILLDVKVGSGAFMKTLDDAVELAKTMVEIGERVGRRTVALITNMDRPLGKAIGNALEVTEAVSTVRGVGPGDLTMVCRELAANMLYLAGKGSLSACERMVRDAILSGAAFEKLQEMVSAQGGDARYVTGETPFERAAHMHRVRAPKSGYIGRIDTERMGMASVVLGAGRMTKESPVDHSAGILLGNQYGEWVDEGFEFARLYTNDPASIAAAEELFLGAVEIVDEEPAQQPLVLGRVSAEGVQLF